MARQQFAGSSLLPVRDCHPSSGLSTAAAWTRRSELGDGGLSMAVAGSRWTRNGTDITGGSDVEVVSVGRDVVLFDSGFLSVLAMDGLVWTIPVVSRLDHVLDSTSTSLRLG